MTLQEAKPYLDKPVFGDQGCIDALNLYRLAQEVRELREMAGYRYSSSEVEEMDQDELSEELDLLMSEVGPEDEDDLIEGWMA